LQSELWPPSIHPFRNRDLEGRLLRDAALFRAPVSVSATAPAAAPAAQPSRRLRRLLCGGGGDGVVKRRDRFIILAVVFFVDCGDLVVEGSLWGCCCYRRWRIRRAVNEPIHPRLFHRRREGIEHVRDTFFRRHRDGTRLGCDEDDAGAMSGCRVQGSLDRHVRDDARVEVAPTMAGFEMLRDLGCFAGAGDDSADAVAVFDQAVDDVHSLARVGSYDEDG
jgi:hypothetical protein